MARLREVLVPPHQLHRLDELLDALADQAAEAWVAGDYDADVLDVTWTGPTSVTISVRTPDGLPPEPSLDDLRDDLAEHDVPDFVDVTLEVTQGLRLDVP